MKRVNVYVTEKTEKEGPNWLEKVLNGNCLFS